MTEQAMDKHYSIRAGESVSIRFVLEAAMGPAIAGIDLQCDRIFPLRQRVNLAEAMSSYHA